VLDTGGTGDIGKATATGLAALGARVGITGRDQGLAAAAAADIRAATGNEPGEDSGQFCRLFRGPLCGLGLAPDGDGRGDVARLADSPAPPWLGARSAGRSGITLNSMSAGRTCCRKSAFREADLGCLDADNDLTASSHLAS
jgi:hypothetical protein